MKGQCGGSSNVISGREGGPIIIMTNKGSRVIEVGINMSTLHQTPCQNLMRTAFLQTKTQVISYVKVLLYTYIKFIFTIQKQPQLLFCTNSGVYKFNVTIFNV